MSGRQIIDRWSRSKGMKIETDTPSGRLHYVRECLLMAGGDDAAPIEEIARRVAARLLEAEGKLRDIHLTITNNLPAR